ncbi:hypothetical protein LIA77_09224 [Sarocladium implicatum]|nr:hypothetical protein LIA77_09224 [Sarocladium implicatum]
MASIFLDLVCFFPGNCTLYTTPEKVCRGETMPNIITHECNVFDLIRISKCLHDPQTWHPNRHHEE